MPHVRLHSLVVAAIAALLVFPAGRAFAADAPVPRVGIVVTVQVNVNEQESTLLAQRLGDALQDKLLVDVIAGREVTRRLADLQLPEDCVAQKACIAEVGKRLDADQLIFLVIVRVGKQFQIDPTWAEVSTGRTLAREAIALDEAEALPERVFRPRAQKLLPDAKPRESSSSATLIVGGGREPEGRHFTTPVWIAGGISAAALVGGAIFGFSALSTDSGLKDDGCDVHPCSDADSRADRLESQMTAADILFGTALVAGGVAAYFYWTSAESAKPADASHPAAATPALGVSAGPGGVVVNFAGHF